MEDSSGAKTRYSAGRSAKGNLSRSLARRWTNRGAGGGFGGGGGGFGGRGGGFGGDMGGYHAGGGYWHGGIWHNGNYWHAPIYHGAWYAGEENWDSPHCGYYLYPPCRYQ